MDLSGHGHQGQPTSNRHSAQWMAVNRPLYPTERRLEPATTPTRPVPLLLPLTPNVGLSNMSITSPVANTFRSPGSNIPRTNHVPLLPRLQPLPLVKRDLKMCMICGRRGCGLVSHKHYVDQALAKRRFNSLDAPVRQRNTVGSPVSSRPPRQPPGQSLIQSSLTVDAEYQQLLDLWSQYWGLTHRGPERHLFPVQWIRTIPSTATHHASLFHALLATSAAMWALAHDSMHDVALRNMQRADQVLIDHSRDQADASVDECLLAALLLVLVYQIRGDLPETERRFSGIAHLVSTRGGPHYLGMAGVVAELLMYTDHVQAILLDKEPVWNMSLPPLRVGIKPRLGAGFRSLIAPQTFASEVLLAADSLSRATDIFEQPVGYNATMTGALNSFGYLSMVSEYQLARCYNMLYKSNTWNECICLALLLFSHSVLRNDGVITAVVRKLERRFWVTVEVVMAQDSAKDVPPCLLLWMLITALTPCITTGCEHRVLAVKAMRAAKISAAITGWEHFRAKVLDDFVWMRAAQEEHFHDVWLEVEGRKTQQS